MRDLSALADLLSPRPKGEPQRTSGGCIHDSFEWDDCFIKTNSANQAANFKAEAAGLKAIAATRTIRVPEVVLQGTTGELAFLVLERLDLQQTGSDSLLGEQLAALHDVTGNKFGFDQSNFIGATPQPNPWTDRWVQFFRDHRLGHQLKLLDARGIRFPCGERFLARLPELLPSKPQASLIHGDLWGGNRAFLPDGTPVVFDPSAHFADAECDLAMTELFGGFSPAFHEAYRHRRPAPEGVAELHEIYRLYHVLNHALLFGGSYVTQARGMMERFV